MSFWNSVANLGGVTDFLMGGKPKDSYNHGQTMGANEQGLLDNVQGRLGTDQWQSANISDPATQDQLRNMVMKYVGDSEQGTNPTQDNINQATNFVDQTYTNPQKAALAQYQGDFQDAQNAKAAAMGRNPNTDTATAQAVYGEGQRNTINLQNNRAAMIQQQAQNFNDQGFTRQGQGIQGGMMGGNYLNSLAQQAFTNRMNVLNGQTGLASYYQRDRLNNRTMGGGGTSSGLLTNFNSIGSGLSNIGGGLETGKGIMSSMGGSGGGGGGGMGLMGLAAM